jgi:hypothetical protein
VPSDEAAPPLEDILPDHDPSNDSDRA